MARYVNIATVSYDPNVCDGNDMERRVSRAKAYIEQAALCGVNIVAFPEAMMQRGVPMPVTETAESLDGFSVSQICRAARQHDIHVIWPLYLHRKDRITNSSILCDNKGSIIGIYDKMYPVITELDAGVSPGLVPGLFHTKFGRIGLCICYDLNFPEVMEGLGVGGAEIVFFSSAYIGGLKMQFWAMHQGYYMASAVLGNGGRIVDISGRVLASTSGVCNPPKCEAMLVQQINLDRVYLHMDYNELKIRDMLKKYGSRINIEYYWEERCITVASNDIALPLKQIIKEFKLETQKDFFKRAKIRRNQAKERLPNFIVCADELASKSIHM